MNALCGCLGSLGRFPGGVRCKLCSAVGQGWEFISLPRQDGRKDSKASMAHCLLSADPNQAELPAEL